MSSYAEMRKKQTSFLNAMKEKTMVESIVDRFNKLIKPKPPKTPQSSSDWSEK